MPPKKNTTTGSVSGDKKPNKPTRRRRKCVVKKSSKVCKDDLGADIAISCIKDVKPVTRGIKRKVTQNKFAVVNNEHTANDSKNTERNSSNNNQPVAKKRRITRKLEIKSSMVTRNCKKNPQVEKQEEGEVKSKILTLKHKVIPKHLNIVRTFVNDYVPDKVTLENDTNSVTPTLNTTTKCFKVLTYDNLKKNPIIILKKLVVNDNNSNIRDESEKSLENNNHSNTTNGQTNCGNNVDLGSDALSQDTSPSRDPSQELGLDQLFFLDHYISMLHQYTGFSPENNVDFSKKKLHLNIQTQELKNITSGGILRSDASCSDYVNTGSITLNTQIHEKKLNNTPEPNAKEQVPEAVIEGLDFDPDSFNYTDDDDDDDTISLFAESLSSFETTPKIPYNSKVDKYKPIVDSKDDTAIFKIPKPVVLKHCIKVCEKQKADSTSFGLSEVSDKKVELMKPTTKLDNKFTTKTTKSRVLSPVLPGSHTPITFVRSAVFKGICIFNIMKNCKNSKCNFPHTILTQSFVSEKLVALTEEQFHQEYLMVCKKAQLLRVYGLVYLNEGIRRKNYRIVVEITLYALIIFNHTQDKQMITEIIERTLLYLNQVNLKEICDLLISEFKPGVQVCDKFLEVIGQTQNFSRFKIVFVKLAMFMCEQNRTFKSDTVSQIVERLCILPYSFDLARAVVDILKRTDRIVFCNSMINVFERKLLKFDNPLLNEFVKLKDQSNNQCTRMDDGDTKWNISDKAIRYSPDTTNKDSLDRHEQVEVGQPDQSQQSRPRRLHPKFNWGSPGPVNQFHRTFRPQANYGQTPRLRPQNNPRQRWPNRHERLMAHIPSLISLRLPSLQNIPQRKNKGPFR
ncbi:uncharacterized protein LOC123709859 isoform X2 [Pieris brassicae]|uniref:uncharacterized protein LOC123709859 isoform X2 n=1 Tax=Pieris brassicae TaxID=7116 RepID=UPI001E65F65E|nr:uncharacterized protein LOC123709859 isoform X2 [Pieris brassicae]